MSDSYACYWADISSTATETRAIFRSVPNSGICGCWWVGFGATIVSTPYN